MLGFPKGRRSLRYHSKTTKDHAKNTSSKSGMLGKNRRLEMNAENNRFPAKTE